MGLTHLLDTNTVSYALRGEGRVAERLLETERWSVAMSSVTLAELRFGAELRGSKKIHRAIDTIVSTLAVVSFDAAAANTYTRVAAQLVRSGRPIETLDAMLAGHALSLGCTMVTRNTSQLARVPGLTVVDWY